MSADAILEIDNLVGGYGATEVLHGLSVKVATGGVTAFCGK